MKGVQSKVKWGGQWGDHCVNGGPWPPPGLKVTPLSGMPLEICLIEPAKHPENDKSIPLWGRVCRNMLAIL